MQAVDILRYDKRVGQASDRQMRSVRLRITDETSPPFVPLPDEKRVARECLRGRKVLGPIVAPKATLTAERRDPAVG